MLLVWLEKTGCQCLRHGTLVAFAQFSRRHILPAQSAREEILTVVLKHLQKRPVGLDNFTFEVRDEYPQNAGVDQALDFIFGGLAFGDVAHGPDKFAVARCILYRVSYRVDVLDSPVRPQQTIGMLEICRPPRRTIDDLLKVGPVLRMDALHH